MTLVAVAVLFVGALALWLAYREHAGDAELAEVLVESFTSEHGRLNLGFFNSTSDTPGPRVLLPGDTKRLSSANISTQEKGGLPFSVTSSRSRPKSVTSKLSGPRVSGSSLPRPRTRPSGCST